MSVFMDRCDGSLHVSVHIAGDVRIVRKITSFRLLLLLLFYCVVAILSFVCNTIFHFLCYNCGEQRRI